MEVYHKDNPLATLESIGSDLLGDIFDSFPATDFFRFYLLVASPRLKQIMLNSIARIDWNTKAILPFNLMPNLRTLFVREESLPVIWSVPIIFPPLLRTISLHPDCQLNLSQDNTLNVRGFAWEPSNLPSLEHMILFEPSFESALSGFPPTLTKLELYRMMAHSVVNFFADTHPLTEMLPNVLSMTIHCLTPRFMPGWIRLLPRSLTHFWFNGFCNLNPAVSSLIAAEQSLLWPPNLTSVGFMSRTVMKSEFEALPRNIIHLSTDFLWGSNMNFDVASLFPKLESYKATVFPRQLPNTLKKLQIHLYLYSFIPTDLPPALTHLEIHSPNGHISAALNSLATLPQLTFLDLVGPEFNVLETKFWSPLTHLGLTWRSGVNNYPHLETILPLIPSLTSFKLFNKISNHLVKLEDFWPFSLQGMSLTNSIPTKLAYLEFIGCTVQPGTLKWLPKHLKRFQIDHIMETTMYYPIDRDSTVRNQLDHHIELRICRPYYQTPSISIISLLPPSTQLMKEFTHPTDLPSIELNLRHLSISEHFCPIPELLKSPSNRLFFFSSVLKPKTSNVIELMEVESKEAYSACKSLVLAEDVSAADFTRSICFQRFQNVFGHITRLCILTKFPSLIFSSLPVSLIELVYDVRHVDIVKQYQKCTKLSAKELARLPLQIEKLVLIGAHITSDLIQFLPKHLRYLKVAILSISPNHVYKYHGMLPIWSPLCIANYQPSGEYAIKELEIHEMTVNVASRMLDWAKVELDYSHIYPKASRGDFIDHPTLFDWAQYPNPFPPSITKCDLSKAYVTSASAVIGNMPNLVWLDIRYPRFKTLDYLPPKLTHLTTRNIAWRPSSFLGLEAKVPDLKSLHTWKQSASISDLTIEALPKSLTEFKTDGSCPDPCSKIGLFCENLPNLKCLHLLNSCRVSYNTPKVHPNLKELVMGIWEKCITSMVSSKRTIPDSLDSFRLLLSPENQYFVIKGPDQPIDSIPPKYVSTKKLMDECRIM